MTTAVRREADTYELEARGALREFSDNRNRMVHFQLERVYSETKRMEFVTLHARPTFLTSVLFHEFTSMEEQQEILREAYTVGINLMTDVERSTGAGVTDMTDTEGLSHQDTGEDKAVFAAKIEAAASSFSGVTSLKALALMCGYSVEEVTSLSQEEVTEMCAFVAKFGAQLPWAVLVENIKTDIDPSLFTSLLDSRDGLLAMALL